MLILYFRVLRIYVNYAFNDDKVYDVDTTVMNEIRATDYNYIILLKLETEVDVIY
jgi:hypothetical protein